MTLVVAAEAVVMVALLALLFGHGSLRTLRARRDASKVKRARALLNAAIDGSLSEADVTELRGLRTALKLRLFEELMVNVSGSALLRLRAVAAAAGIQSDAKAETSSRRWWRRLRGARAHTLLGGGESVVPQLLNDPVAEVRSQAAMWAAEHRDEATANALVELLAHGDGKTRFFVIDALVRLGSITLDPLRTMLAAGSGDIASALRVARHIADRRLLAPAVRHSHAPDPAIRKEAASVLAAIGGEDAVLRLRDLIDDPDSGVRATAITGLGRLGDWRTAARIAASLTDRAWDVRRAAGLALQSLGAPGTLFLRRALESPDPFAADMARHVLGFAAPVSSVSAYV